MHPEPVEEACAETREGDEQRRAPALTLDEVGPQRAVHELVTREQYPDRGRRPDQRRRDRCGHGPAPLGEDDEDEAPRERGRHAPSRGGEVDGGCDHGHRGERQATDQTAVCDERQPQEERDAEREEDRQPVPVAEREAEPGDGSGEERRQVTFRERAGEEPADQRDCGDSRDRHCEPVCEATEVRARRDEHDDDERPR